jgi:hypothetical protein
MQLAYASERARQWLVALLVALASPLVVSAQSYAIKPTPADGIQFVTAEGNDANDGLSWGTAKATLGGAQSGCPVGGPCAIRLTGQIIQSANLTITRPQTSIECEPGTTITQNAGGSDSIDIKASHGHIRGCAFVAGTSTDSIVIVNTVADWDVSGNSFSGFPASGGNTVIFVGNRTNLSLGAAVSDIRIHDNWFTENSAIHVNIQDYAMRISVTNNTVVTASSTDNNPIINAQTSDSGTVIQDLNVSGNIIFNGITSDCVQAQRLSGNQLEDVTVTGNHCIIQSGGSGTGYSLAGIKGYTETGNIFDSTASPSAGTGNAPFESVNNSNGTESGNTAYLGNNSMSGEPFAFTLIADSGTESNVTVVGNAVQLQYTGGGTGGCFYVGTSTTSTVTSVSIHGNNCYLTGSTGKAVGVWVQSNSSSASVTNTSIARNNWFGADVTGDAGIAVEKDAGTLTGTYVGPNLITNFHLVYSSNLGAQTSGLLPTEISYSTIPDANGNPAQSR